MPLIGMPMLSRAFSIHRAKYLAIAFCTSANLLDFLDAGADLGAHMHQDLSASTLEKKFRPRNGTSSNESRRAEDRSLSTNNTGRAHRHRQQSR